MLVDYSKYKVPPNSNFTISSIDPGASSASILRPAAEAQFRENRKRMAKLQERLYAEGKQALLVVLQAMDTGGKDSTIRAVTRGVNPQGFRIYGFKAPTRHELARDFLWRVHHQVPPKGKIGIFNRSHYEDVLIVRVHGWASPSLTEKRYQHINNFEKLLSDHGTKVVKIMLHISKEYQKERLVRRLRRPDKLWKFNPGDLKERAKWSDYMNAFEIALQKCSTSYAPWYVVPAQKRWYRNLLVSQIMVDALDEMNPQYPEADFDVSAYPPESIV